MRWDVASVLINKTETSNMFKNVQCVPKKIAHAIFPKLTFLYIWAYKTSPECLVIYRVLMITCKIKTNTITMNTVIVIIFNMMNTKQQWNLSVHFTINWIFKFLNIYKTTNIYFRFVLMMTVFGMIYSKSWYQSLMVLNFSTPATIKWAD